MHGGRIRYQSAARNVRATGKRNVERPGRSRPKHAYEVRPRKDKRGVDPIFDALPFGLLWYGERGLRSRTESGTRSFTVQRIAVIRAYDDDGDVIETHEHAGDFRQF
jgi:hypothetical protein